MNTFEAFVHDDRYTVPTLHLLSAKDDVEARTIADALLRASPHHLGVELCRNGEQIGILGACPARRPTGKAEVRPRPMQ
ncbi:MAG TPA: hypothetical protein VHV27_08660 [Phenylobacterium sp.]|jgi:hypothetical protein|nr:hypothetical protein [Phenylobacterium sp.]